MKVLLLTTFLFSFSSMALSNSWLASTQSAEKMNNFYEVTCDGTEGYSREEFIIGLHISTADEAYSVVEDVRRDKNNLKKSCEILIDRDYKSIQADICFSKDKNDFKDNIILRYTRNQIHDSAEQLNCKLVRETMNLKNR